MSVNVYAVIGGGDTRKSSSVRALTGVGQRKAVAVATVTGAMQTFVQISALQESEISPGDFVHDMNSGGHQNILVTLRDAPLHKGGAHYPSGSDYIQEFIRAGWNIHQVVVLGAHHLSYALPP